MRVFRVPGGVRIVDHLPRSYRLLRIRWWRFRRRASIGLLMRIYVAILTLLSMLPAFVLGFLVLFQAADPKRKALEIFPAGLNDAAALLPLAIGVFTALLFNAQQSVRPQSRRYRLYGVAARRLLLGFYLFGLSFLNAVGSRFMQAGAFKGWRLEWLLNEWANLVSALPYINGLIAFGLFVNALWHYVLTVRETR